MGGGAEGAAGPDRRSHSRDHDSERGSSHHAGLTQIKVLHQVIVHTGAALNDCVGVSSQVGLQQRISELEQKFDCVVMLIGSLGLLQPDADPCQDCNIKGAG